MNETASNNQLRTLSVAIIVAAVIIAGCIWATRATNKPLTDSDTRTAQQLVEMRQEMATRLNSLEQKVNTQQNQPTNTMPAPRNEPTPSMATPAPTPVAANTKVIYQDPAQRFSIVATPPSCTLTSTLVNNEAPNSYLPNQSISMRFPSYGEWMTYSVLTKVQLDGLKENTLGPDGPGNEWKLSDNSYLISFGPQDLPDAARNCTVSVKLK